MNSSPCSIFQIGLKSNTIIVYGLLIREFKNKKEQLNLTKLKNNKGLLSMIEWNGGMECDSYFHSIHLFGVMK